MQIIDQNDHRNESEDASLRAPVYGLLAGLLVRPPDAAFLQAVGVLRGDDSGFGQALNDLAGAALATGPQQAELEYNALFIGVTRGELVPYASYYRTGFLHDRPLARVRHDLNRLALERVPGVAEPEDHIAGLCEVMALLCARNEPGLGDQIRFFQSHLAPWSERFFRDLQAAPSARLYRFVAALALAFFEIEERAARLALQEFDSEVLQTGDVVVAGDHHVA